MVPGLDRCADNEEQQQASMRAKETREPPRMVMTRIPSWTTGGDCPRGWTPASEVKLYI